MRPIEELQKERNALWWEALLGRHTLYDHIGFEGPHCISQITHPLGAMLSPRKIANQQSKSSLSVVRVPLDSVIPMVQEQRVPYHSNFVGS